MKDTCVIAFSNFLSLISVSSFFAYGSIKASFIITVMVYHPQSSFLYCTFFQSLTNCYKRRFIYSCKITLVGNMSRYFQSHCFEKKGRTNDFQTDLVLAKWSSLTMFRYVFLLFTCY